MDRYKNLEIELLSSPKVWLVTGVAGFIGSNILEALLKLNQRVVGLDNFSTGYKKNLEEVERAVSAQQWAAFHFIEGDIRSIKECHLACEGVDYVLHEAALGSVPLSIDDPIGSNEVNVNGFLNMLTASRDAGVMSFTYATSSAVYGDDDTLPKIESTVGNPLSPYSVTKNVNEIYAHVYAEIYKMKISGLRYFNVFGKRQDPKGAYAAVIPSWVAAMLENKDVYINGDGLTSRDFCYVDNVVQANLLAAAGCNNSPNSVIYNVGLGLETTLLDLFSILAQELECFGVSYSKDIMHREFRAGDIKYSYASINKIKRDIGYNPLVDVRAGISNSIEWYISFFRKCDAIIKQI